MNLQVYYIGVICLNVILLNRNFLYTRVRNRLSPNSLILFPVIKYFQFFCLFFTLLSISNFPLIFFYNTHHFNYTPIETELQKLGICSTFCLFGKSNCASVERDLKTCMQNDRIFPQWELLLSVPEKYTIFIT